MCTHRDKEGVCLAAFFIYQVALVYVWILFLLSINDIETFYCPNKITGKIFTVYLNKTIIRKRSKQKEIDPKFGVSEWDPAELDIRQTRHGTYESRPPPRGGTWRDQIKEEAYKLRQRQREADSPEFISPHSTTDTMDTDEAQEINKQIMEKIEKEPEGFRIFEYSR